MHTPVFVLLNNQCRRRSPRSTGADSNRSRKLQIRLRRSELPLGQLQLERVSMQVQKPRGLALIPSDPLEDAEDDLSFELIAGLLERHDLVRAGAAGGAGEHQLDGEVPELDG